MKSKKKGFTLVEMIIVLAIMGILLLLLVPSWMNYITKSKIKTQNANSRVIFNAAQTVAQEYNFSERKEDAAHKFLTKSGPTGSESIYFYWDGSNGKLVDQNGNALAGGAAQTAFANNFARKINNIYDNADESIYIIEIKDYIVLNVYSARWDGDRYIGSYPNKKKDPSPSTELVKEEFK